MSDALVRLRGVGKLYKVFPSRTETVLDALGVNRLLGRRVAHRELWALRGIDLELRRGARVGVIGRNGAGKTTLLKLLTGTMAPSEGELDLRGTIQPLMELGVGFHPELTGLENIDAALAYQGLTGAELRDAKAEIMAFTELGDDLEQPIKTYSLGMLARLAFAAATAVKPEVLVIDEVLGAGDAYFLAKSADRMQQLVGSGAAVILVSHALDQITRLCEEAIWLERGRIVMRGSALEVMKAYQEFIRRLDDRRLRAKHRKVMAAQYSAEETDNRIDTLAVQLSLSGAGSLDVDAVTLRKDGAIEDRLDVGAAQDSESSQSSFVVAGGDGWSPPATTERGWCRRLESSAENEVKHGRIAFVLYLYIADAQYEVELSYRTRGRCRVSLDALVNDVPHAASEVPTTADRWATHRVALKAAALPADRRSLPPDMAARTLRRWPGEGSLMIEDVALRGVAGDDRAVFEVGTPMSLHVTFGARRGGTFDVIPAATLYRVDGILVSNHVGASRTLTMDAGARGTARLDFGPLNLGNGNYVFSIALYRRLSATESEWYDLIAHSYEFQVVGNGPFENGIFRHPGDWSVDVASQRLAGPDTGLR